MTPPTLARGSLRIVGGRVNAVIDVAMVAFDVTEEELLGPSQKHPICVYRQITMAACRRIGHSFPAIGAAFGGRDHTTVMHACSRVEADPELDRRARIIAEAVANKPGELF